MITPESLKDLPAIAIVGLIILAGLWFLSKSLLPSISFLVTEQAKAVGLQQALSKNVEDTYEKRLAANNELMKQQFISSNMERDRERDLQLTKLKEDMLQKNSIKDKQILELLDKIDLLEKRITAMDEFGVTKDKQIDNLLSQVADLTKERDKLLTEVNGLIDRVKILESQIATLLHTPSSEMPVPPHTEP